MRYDLSRMAFVRSMILKTAGLPAIERLVRKSFLFRSLVRRFVAGDTLEEAMTQVELLCEKGFLVSLDYLGENTQSELEALAAKDTYIAMLRRIALSSHRTMINISIKLTQCGLDQGDQLAETNYRAVLDVAKQSNTFVRVDMESSHYTERTIAMIERVFPEYPLTGTVLQSYLYRSIDDVRRMNELGARVRVVKGAYLEPESVAYKDKGKVDQAYVEIAKLLLEHGHYPAIATHDGRIIDIVRAFVTKQSISKEDFEFQMLFGIRRDLQDQLHAEGYNVRIYVPFGEMWYPYFTRRLAERPANAFFILKSLFKG